MRFPLFAALALAAAAAAPAAAEQRGDTVQARGEARLARALQARTAGTPQNCIRLNMARSSEVIPGTAIVYRQGSRLWVNRPNGAEALDGDTILVTRTTLNQLCSIDIVNLVDRTSGIWRGSVGLNQFVPYDRPGRR